jgi:glutamyl-tRNA synthetase
VTFTDVIRGPISIDTTDLGDFIIGRSVTEPLYHFGVVVDDLDEGVTHIIRGEDHISNTPRQILIQRALGVVEPPVYAHLPLVLGPDKAKLSKRRGAKAVIQYRDEGFIPEAVVNYLALLGWHPEGEQEIFTLNELIEHFTITRIQKGSGIFDETKLRWFNHEHLKRLSVGEYEMRLRAFIELHHEVPPSYLFEIVDELKGRSQTLGEAVELIRAGEFAFMEEQISYDPSLLVQGAKTDIETVRKNLNVVLEMLSKITDDGFTREAVKETIFPYATQEGRAGVLWPLRVAVSGKEKSPDPFIVAGLIGKEKTLERIKQALDPL